MIIYDIYIYMANCWAGGRHLYCIVDAGNKALLNKQNDLDSLKGSTRKLKTYSL